MGILSLMLLQLTVGNINSLQSDTTYYFDVSNIAIEMDSTRKYIFDRSADNPIDWHSKNYVVNRYDNFYIKYYAQLESKFISDSCLIVHRLYEDSIKKSIIIDFLSSKRYQLSYDGNRVIVAQYSETILIDRLKSILLIRDNIFMPRGMLYEGQSRDLYVVENHTDGQFKLYFIDLMGIPADDTPLWHDIVDLLE